MLNDKPYIHDGVWTIDIPQYICQQCLSKVGYQEKCFLCGEINWNDEILHRIALAQKDSGSSYETYMMTYKPMFHTFGVYPKDFKLM